VLSRAVDAICESHQRAYCSRFLRRTRALATRSVLADLGARKNQTAKAEPRRQLMHCFVQSIRSTYKFGAAFRLSARIDATEWELHSFSIGLRHAGVERPSYLKR
jgi:hypothetical protein